MTTRDARGRFTNADHAAAERVIEAAVRRGVEVYRIVPTEDGPFMAEKNETVTRLLLTATVAADLLLSERAS